MTYSDCTNYTPHMTIGSTKIYLVLYMALKESVYFIMLQDSCLELGQLGDHFRVNSEEKRCRVINIDEHDPTIGR